MEHPARDTQGQTAPSVTLAQVEAAIVSETYTLLPNGRTTICQLTLDNGFTVEGKSACVSLANYNAEKGNHIARENALDDVWQVLGFRLADHLAMAAKAPEVDVAVPEEGHTHRSVQLGDQVLFYERVGEQESAPMLALVTSVHSADWIAVTVLAPNGTVHAREKVMLVYPWSRSPDLPFYARLKQS